MRKTPPKRLTTVMAVTGALLSAAVMPAGAAAASPALAGAGLAASAQRATERDAVPSGLIDATTFADPPAKVGPGTRWWWGPIFGAPQGELSEEQTRTQLRAIHDAGFDRVEIAYGETHWATQQQRDNLAVALDEAAKLDMQVDTTLGAAWPLETPNTSAGTGLSLRELQYGRVEVAAGQTYAGQVPRPFDDLENERDGKLIAVTAARVVEPGPPVEEVNVPPVKSTVLDPASMVDVTASVEDGSIRWTAPSQGEWILFAFWQRDAAEDVHDHFNREAIQAAVDFVKDEQFSPQALERFRESGYAIFEDSLEIDAEGVFWTEGMLEHFRERRGYDPTKLLPLFFQQGMNAYWVPEDPPPGDFELPGGDGERVRNDFYELLTDLYVSEHLVPLVQEAAELGGVFRTQAAFGQNLDVVRSTRELAQAGGHADDESLNAGDMLPYDLEGNAATWRFALDHHRAVSSGSHQGGSTEISSELGAILGQSFVMTLADYKGMMDKEWAAGTTRPLIHGTSYQTPTAPWPGDPAFFNIITESWNAEHHPQWRDWRPLNDYWARGALVLQTGTPKTDVAVYLDDFITTAAVGFGPAAPRKPLFEALSMEQRGYTVGYLDPNGVLEPEADGRGTLYPAGPDYDALVIDERALPADVAEKIAEEAAQGLSVVLVGELPSEDTGYANARADDARVVAAVQRMLAQPSVRRVASQEAAGAALAALGVEPAAAWSEPTQVYTQRRQTADAEYYYLYNATNEPVQFDGSFVGSGRPMDYDLWSGEITPLAVYDQDGDRTEVTVELEARGTAVIAIPRRPSNALHLVQAEADEVVDLGGGRFEFRSTTPGEVTYTTSVGGRGQVTMPELPEPVEVGGWNLKVDSWGPDGVEPVFDAELASLQDWRTLPGLAGVSGVGRYSASVALGADWVEGTRGALLDIGEVAGGSIQVRVNGEKVTPDPVPGRAWDISDHLKAGDNLIEVELATTLRNVYTAENAGVPPLIPGLPTNVTQAYGLLGPVVLTPYGRAQVDVTVSEVSFEELDAAIRAYVADGRLAPHVARSLQNRLDQASAALYRSGSEKRAIVFIEHFVARARNQVKGDAQDIEVRDALTAQAEVLLAALRAADRVEDDTA